MFRADIVKILKNSLTSFFIVPAILFSQNQLHARSLDFPTSKYGISIGNSPIFTGLRINWKDMDVERIKGVNLTLWMPGENKQAEMTGINIGLVPSGGNVTGLNLGFLGAAAQNKLEGVNLGFIGMGSGNDMTGINIGGIGIGTGGDLTGINIAGIGMGSGGDQTGLNISGIGIGSGGNLSGLNVSGIGMGSGKNIRGLTIGMIGAGAGEDLSGLSICGLGFGAGKNISGINIAGLGMGAGSELKGLSIAGIGAGSPKISGITIAGIGSGGGELNGLFISGGVVKVTNDGTLTGFAASAFNQIEGTQKGVSLGIVNYAYELEGVQIGLINIVRDNPKFFRILPIVNWHFN